MSSARRGTAPPAPRSSPARVPSPGPCSTGWGWYDGRIIDRNSNDYLLDVIHPASALIAASLVDGGWRPGCLLPPEAKDPRRSDARPPRVDVILLVHHIIRLLDDAGLVEAHVRTSECALIHQLLVVNDRGSLQARTAWRRLPMSDRDHVVHFVHHCQRGLRDFEAGRMPQIERDGRDPIRRMREAYLVARHGVDIEALAVVCDRGYGRLPSVIDRYPLVRVEHVLAAMFSSGITGPLVPTNRSKAVRQALIAAHPEYDEQRDPSPSEVYVYAWMAHALCPARIDPMVADVGRASMGAILTRRRIVSAGVHPERGRKGST